MSRQTIRVMLAAVLAVGTGASALQAQDSETNPFPGLTYIKRTLLLPPFQCFACPNPTPNPRIARINILVIDLGAPEIRFKLTPRGTNLPAVLPGSTTAGWPLPPPPFETVRQTTLAFINSSHAQAAINSHFFAPFPVPGGSTQGAYAYLIGLAASRGNVYSAFESPFQSYAIVTNSPGLNIDSANQASIVHRDPNVAGGVHVVENVQLWNALSGSGQIVTNGVTTIPEYKDATHPDAPLDPIAPYSRAGRHWYDLSNARTAIGLTQDNRTLVLFTVDGTNGGHGMQAGEVADLLRNDYHVWNALNLDGGGSATMALEDPVTHVRRLVNVPSDNPPRAEASNLAVYADGVDPVTTAATAPAPNANGWNNTSVTVSLSATDLASGILDTPAGWVDQVQYSLAGAQTSGPQVVPGNATSFALSTPGVTTVTYFATDAAGNEERARTHVVKLDGGAPAINGLPGSGCSLWPPNHKMKQVAVVSASDAVSGVASLEVTVTSNEPSDPGDPDFAVTPDGSGGFAVSLRAERLGGGSGRIYTIAATATDLAGNLTTASAFCTVAHDQR
ncbi:MAG TPA: phosphodiester glycosidase family protein [Vicinamibacteria bacterium]|nr:phosphodiester glycosidase family protein [Vicinamibacteria bacterium]